MFTIFETFSSVYDMKILCIDLTLVKSHQHSCGAKKSKTSEAISDSQGGKTTKIYTITDEKGVPLCFKLTTGNKNDCTQAVTISKYLPLNGSNVNKPWNYNKKTYKKRNVIERFFNKIKLFRRVACRYDKPSDCFLAFVYIAPIFIITKWHNGFSILKHDLVNTLILLLLLVLSFLLF